MDGKEAFDVWKWVLVANHKFLFHEEVFLRDLKCIQKKLNMFKFYQCQSN